MLWHIAGAILARVGEKLVDFTQDTVTIVKDYKLTLETLERNLKAVNAKALDVREEVQNAEQSGNKKRKREVEEWLAEVQKLETEFAELKGDTESEGFLSRFFEGGQAKLLSGRLDELLEQSKHFGGLVLDVYETKGVPFLGKKLVGEKFEQNFRKIWSFLVDDRVKSVGIHGMGGAGKTSLAKRIHNRFLEEPSEFVLWVTVSEEGFTVKNVQDEIARIVGVDFSNEQNEDIRAARLHRGFSQRGRFVLILDDVWKNIKLEKIGDPLSLEGGKLIITTRSMEVCRRIGCQEVVQVEKLDNREAWELFKEILGPQTTLTPEIQEIAERMTKKCDGLPLGLIVTAGSMKGISNIHQWRNALVELHESIMNEDDNDEMVFRILKYSFDWLDQGEKKCGGYTKLQLCFLHCCLYPEDRKIEENELINDFFSEEFLDKKKSWIERIDEGHAKIRKLVDVCLLEEGGGEESGMKRWVKMHDLVRAMSLKITEGKYMSTTCDNFLKEIMNEDATKNLEKIFMIGCYGMKEIADGLSTIFPKLSTFLLHNGYFPHVPSSFFRWMLRLHVLDLSFTYITALPDSLSDLGSLKSLLLFCCAELQCIPDLGNLEELRNLNLSGTSIKKLPRGMKKLVNLECLKIDARKLKMLPRNLLPKLQKLQCLHLPFHIEAPVKEIEKLNQVVEFKGRVKDIFDFDILMQCQLCLNEYSRTYKVKVNPESNMEDRIDDGYNVMGDSREVFMSGTDLTKGGTGGVNKLASEIQKLSFHGCKGLKSCLLDDSRRLNFSIKSLRMLEIGSCEGIERLTRGESEYPFQNLEKLELDDLPDFMGIVSFQGPRTTLASPPLPPSAFSALRRLLISGCNKMKKLGLPPRGLQNLKEMRIESCKEVEEIMHVADEDGEGNEALVVDLPKLHAIHLIDLPRLKRFCKATVICASIREIYLSGLSVESLPLSFGSAISHLKYFTVRDCNQIKKIGLPSWALQKLEEIAIRRCDELEEIMHVTDDNGEGNEALVVHLPNLKSLTLCFLPRLKSFCKAKLICASISSIEMRFLSVLESFPLIFGDCNSLTTTGSAISYLKVLVVQDCDKMKKIGLPSWALQNLGGISITTCEELEEILLTPNEHQPPICLPNLRVLRLEDLPKLTSVARKPWCAVEWWRELHWGDPNAFFVKFYVLFYHFILPLVCVCVCVCVFNIYYFCVSGFILRLWLMWVQYV